MKIHIWRDERYPDYGLSDKAGRSFATTRTVEVDEATHERFVRVIAEYYAVQEEIEKLFDGAGK